MKEFFTKTALPYVLTAAMMSAAFPAMAGKDFIKEDLRNEKREVVQLLGQRLSDDKLTLVVYGGTRNLMMAPYNVAQRLDDEGIPVAFLLAPEHDDNEDTAHVDFYTKGATKYFVLGFSNGDMASFEQSLYEQAIKAYEEGFGNIPTVAAVSVDKNEPTVALR